MKHYLTSIVMLLSLLGCGSEDDGLSFTRDTSNLEVNINGGKGAQFNAILTEQYSLVAGSGRACAYGALNSFVTLKC